MDDQNVQKTNLLITTFMITGFMISPLSLVILGNGAGETGFWMLWVLPIFAMLNLRTTYLFKQLFHNENSSYPKIFVRGLRRWIISLLQLSSLVPFCIAVSTLILAKAGFVFNEIFLYWFPNLFFSVCFLVFIVGINIMRPSLSRCLQGISVFIFLGSILFLLISGLVNWEKTIVEAQNTMQSEPLHWRHLILGFWLFMAGELAVYHNTIHQQRPVSLFNIVCAFVVSLVIFISWGKFALHFVSMERLADSTVPHFVVAQAISGEMGQKIMGAAILAGSFASVNLLMAGGSAALAKMARSRQIFPILKNPKLVEKFSMMILFIAILSMLLSGMAGKEITWTIAYSAFYVWLVSYAAFNVFAFQQSRHYAFLSAAIYLGAVAVLIVTDPDLLLVSLFIAGFIIFSGFILILGRNNGGAPVG